MEKQSVKNINSSVYSSFSIAILLRCVGARETKTYTVSDKERTKRRIVEFLTIVTLE